VTASPALARGRVKGASSSRSDPGPRPDSAVSLTDVSPVDYLTPDVAPRGAETGRTGGICGGFSEGGGSMKRQVTGALRRSVLAVAGLAAPAVVTVGFALPASTCGGGASHDPSDDNSSNR
jgi:hypothetical protein